MRASLQWCAALAAAGLLAGCAGAGILAAAGSASAGGDDAPAFARCASAAAQPGWVFKGACVTLPVKPGGVVVRLPAYKGYALTMNLPKNDAKAGAKITLVDATGKGDIAVNAGQKFPLDYTSFLYIKFANAGPAVRLKAGTTVVIKIDVSQSIVEPCSAAHLVIATSKWPAYEDGTVSGQTITYRIPASTFGALPNGVRYLSFECKAPV